jgi:hypothetical protein
MAVVDEDLTAFLRATSNADEHNVVTLRCTAPPGVDVLLESTVPMLDGLRPVVELCAEAANRAATRPGADGAFALGRLAGLEEAVRRLASIFVRALIHAIGAWTGDLEQRSAPFRLDCHRAADTRQGPLGADQGAATGRQQRHVRTHRYAAVCSPRARTRRAGSRRDASRPGCLW